MSLRRLYEVFVQGVVLEISKGRRTMIRFARGGILLGVIAAIALPAGAQQGMAFVDVQNLMLNSSRGQEIQGQLKTEFAAPIAEMRSKEEALSALGSRIASQSATLSAEALEKLRREYQDLQLQLKRLTQDVENGAQQRKTELFSVLEKDLLELIEEIRREKGLGLVFATETSGIIAADPTLNLTDEVMQRLNTVP
jgi:outer membrane protein